MGLSDIVFGQLKAQTFTEGVDICQAADALAAHGHYGCAARLYSQALRRFELTADDASLVKVRQSSEACYEKAVARGEDLSLGSQWGWEEISQDLEVFAFRYYEAHKIQVAKHIFALADARDWRGLLDFVPAAQKVLEFVTFPKLEEDLLYNLCLFPGIAHLNVGEPERAVPLLQKAYRMARQPNMNFVSPDQAKAGTAMHLGHAMLECDDSAGMARLTEADKIYRKIKKTETDDARAKAEIDGAANSMLLACSWHATWGGR